MKHKIHELWNMNSIGKVLEKMQSISKEYPELKSWIKSKQKGWILAGLTSEQSKIPIQWWTYARHHTGLAESSHFQDNNFTGRKLSLLGAVLKYGMFSAYARHILTMELGRKCVHKKCSN